jgi:hypothetical protein
MKCGLPTVKIGRGRLLAEAVDGVEEMVGTFEVLARHAVIENHAGN